MNQDKSVPYKLTLSRLFSNEKPTHAILEIPHKMEVLKEFLFSGGLGYSH